jgi:hypothetical protein
MKLRVLFDKNGHIVAAAQLDDGKSSPGTAVKMYPVATEAGHATAEVNVPNEYAHLDIAAVCQRLKVDPNWTLSIKG